MGTLFKQEPRDDHRVDDLPPFLEAVKLAKQHSIPSIPVSDVIAAKHALELERRNNLYRANGDAFDGQVAGIGESLTSVAEGEEGTR